MLPYLESTLRILRYHNTIVLRLATLSVLWCLVLYEFPGNVPSGLSVGLHM